MRDFIRNTAVVSAATLCATAIAAPAAAQSKQYEVPAQAAQSAISALGRQADIQIIAARSITAGKRTNAVRGNMTIEQALETLLRGTGLTARKIGTQTYTVIPLAVGAPASYLRPSTEVAAAQPSESVTGASSDDQSDPEITVTGSRVQQAGFTAPTPTTSLGDTELRQGNRPSIGEVLNDIPSFRASITPGIPATVTSGATTADLRGLGPSRTLTLLNGHRFIGSLDLNNIPQNIIQRVEVVTGGASAAWGSGAVTGVINIILDDKKTGFDLGADGGISSRGDAGRFRIDGTYGKRFADGRGHVLLSAEYLKDMGAGGRNNRSRPNLDSGLFTLPSGQLLLANDVNFTDAFPGGVIRSGPLAGQVFNTDGTLSQFPFGGQTNSNTTIGGGGRNQNDFMKVTTPYARWNLFGRTSFEISDAATVWIDANWSRVSGNFSFFPDVLRASATSGGIVISKNNPFLSPTVRAQLASGPDTFRLGRHLTDISEYGGMGYRFRRDSIEGAIGVKGSFAEGWSHEAYYDHGESRNRQAITNQRNNGNFLQAVDAVTDATGAIVCRAAIINPTTACRPLNLFGVDNASPEALAYAFGNASDVITQKIDTAGASVRGNLFSTGAGTVAVAAGIDYRKESLSTTDIDLLSQSRSLFINFAPLSGSYNVKEAFGEVVLPLIDLDGAAKLTVNAAARYSDYSNSGGIWSWKTGATLEIEGGLLLRGVYSRDTRSPSISELFTTRSTSVPTVSDPAKGGTAVSVVQYSGGNPALTPEVSYTTSFGGSYMPSFAPRLRASVDYWDIDVADVITTIGAQDAVNQCFRGVGAACTSVERDAGGNITTIFATFQNLAQYKASGIDMELGYSFPLENGEGQSLGNFQFRLLATYVIKQVINNAVTSIDRAGDVGDGLQFSTPHWKTTGTLTFQSGDFLGDLRVRYVGGGNYNSQLNIINNQIAPRVYVDLSARQKIGDFEVFAGVNNLTDTQPPFVGYYSAVYDGIGRYFNAGARINF